MARKIILSEWLTATCGLRPTAMTPLPMQASLRRYFRIVVPDATYIAMDAPPPEDCRPYIAVAQALRVAGLNAPKIKAQDVERGYLLLSDFGDETYLKGLNQQNADMLYERALRALSTLQGISTVSGWNIPRFTAEFMQKEWAWHKEWFLDKLLGIKLTGSVMTELNGCYTLLVDSIVSQPQVFMHRDYHSGNLMVLPGDVGILDFQDAFIGPITYDLASLLRDCYIDWPEALVMRWADWYYHLLVDNNRLKSVDQQTFLRWFDWMSVQRHLKAILTFARKHVRDQDSAYLAHIPRTLRYLQSVTSRYDELAVMRDYITSVTPQFERVSSLCEQ